MSLEAANSDAATERSPDEVAVALCIYGVDLDPQQMTVRLGVNPTHGHKRGETKGPNSPPYKTGAWIFELRKFEPIDLDSMYVELLSRFAQEEALWNALATQYEVRVDFAVHTDAGCGFYVSPATMALIASKQCGFNISIYAYGDA